MSRTKKFMQNTVVSIFQQMVVLAVGLILPRTMLQFYGSEVNGLVSSISQFINYFLLVEAGIGASAVYALYKPLADNNHSKISSIVTASKSFYIKSGYIFTGLVAILALAFPFIRDTKSLSPLQIGCLVFILGASGTLTFFVLAKYTVILTADQRSYVIAISTMAGSVVSTTIIVVMAHLSLNVVVARAAALISLVFVALIPCIYVHKHYPHLDFHAKMDTSSMVNRWDALFQQVIGTVQNGAPVIIASIILDYRQVSVYVIFFMVIGGLSGLLSIFTSGLSASFGDIIVRGETKVLQKTYSQFELAYCGSITLAFSVAFVLVQPFVLIYTSGIHDANYNVPLVGFLMIVNGFIYCLKVPQGTLVISAGLFKETRWQTLVQALILIIAATLFGLKFGLVGILLGAILSNIYRDIDLLFYIPKHVTHMSAIVTVKRWFISILEFAIFLIPFYWIKVVTHNYLEWIVWGIVCTLFSLLVILVVDLLLDRHEFTQTLLRIIKMVRLRK